MIASIPKEFLRLFTRFQLVLQWIYPDEARVLVTNDHAIATATDRRHVFFLQIYTKIHCNLLAALVFVGNMTFGRLFFIRYPAHGCIPPTNRSCWLYTVIWPRYKVLDLSPLFSASARCRPVLLHHQVECFRPGHLYNHGKRQVVEVSVLIP